MALTLAQAKAYSAAKVAGASTSAAKAIAAATPATGVNYAASAPATSTYQSPNVGVIPASQSVATSPNIGQTVRQVASTTAAPVNAAARTVTTYDARTQSLIKRAEEKPTPASVAAAAKAIATAENKSKDEIKAAVSEARSQLVALKDSQDLAAAALKDAGASKTAIDSFKKSSDSELKTVVTSGLLVGNAPTTVTQAVNTSTPAGQAAQARIDAAFKAAELMNVVPGMAPSGMSSTGVSLQSIDRRLQKHEDTGSYGTSSLGQTLQRTLVDWKPYFDPNTNTFNLPKEVLADAGKLKPAGDGLFKIATNTGTDGNINKTTQYFKPNADGSYMLVGTDKYNYDDAPEKSGIGGLGGLIGAGIGFALGPAGWGILGSNLAAGAVGGAVGGGLSEGNLAGILKGGLLGAAGGGFADYMGGMGAFAPDGSFVGPATGTQVGGGIPVNNLQQGITSSALGTTGAGGLSQSMFTGLGDTTADIFAGALQQAGMGTQDAVALGTELANAGVTLDKLPGIIGNMSPTLGTQVANVLNGLGIPTGTGTALGNMLGGSGTPADVASAIGGAAGTVAGTGTAGAIGGVPLTDIFKGMLGIGGGYLNTEAAKDAAEAQAKAQIEAAKIAADAAKFRPVGVTTRFGESKFEFDPETGYLKSAGYTLDPAIKAQQDQLMAASGGLLSQFTGAQAATAPMGSAAQRMMELGQGYLATSPQEQAAKYLAEQQALLATGRERELAALQNKLQQQGRLGLATGGTSTGMMSANPELEAFYNAKRQQDLELAARATQGGMDYAKFGAGMVGSGGTMLRDMYSTQSAAYQPYQTAMGGAQYIEGLGQNAMDIGVNLGKTSTAANAAAGQLLGTGMMNAANTQGQVAQQAGSTWGNLLQGGAQALQNWTQPTQQQAFKYDPYTGKLLGA